MCRRRRRTTRLDNPEPRHSDEHDPRHRRTRTGWRRSGQRRKDFRTWAGTVLAARALRELRPFDTKTQAQKNIVRAIEQVAMRLGNTKAVCRKCYIHPAIIQSYLDGTLRRQIARGADKVLTEAPRKLSGEEAAVFRLLRQRTKPTSELRRGSKRP